VGLNGNTNKDVKFNVYEGAVINITNVDNRTAAGASHADALRLLGATNNGTTSKAYITVRGAGTILNAENQSGRWGNGGGAANGGAISIDAGTGTAQIDYRTDPSLPHSTFKVSDGAVVNLKSTGNTNNPNLMNYAPNFEFLITGAGSTVTATQGARATGTMNGNLDFGGADTGSVYQTLHVTDGGTLTILSTKEAGGNGAAVRFSSGTSNGFLVESGGHVFVDTYGSGTVATSASGRDDGQNRAVDFDGTYSFLKVTGEGSALELKARYGAAVATSGNYSSVEVGPGAIFVASGQTSANNAAIFDNYGTNFTFIADNPLYFDFTNNRRGGGAILWSGANSSFDFTDTDVALWKWGTPINNTPSATFTNVDATISGGAFNANARNTGAITARVQAPGAGANAGTTGFSNYYFNGSVANTAVLTAASPQITMYNLTRISGNNSTPRVDSAIPATNADKYVRWLGSVIEGTAAYRPVWDDEVSAVIKVTPADGSPSYYTTAVVESIGDEEIYSKEDIPNGPNRINEDTGDEEITPDLEGVIRFTPLPAGTTAEQYAALTPDQKAALLNINNLPYLQAGAIYEIVEIERSSTGETVSGEVIHSAYFDSALPAEYKRADAEYIDLAADIKTIVVQDVVAPAPAVIPVNVKLFANSDSLSGTWSLGDEYGVGLGDKPGAVPTAVYAAVNGKFIIISPSNKGKVEGAITEDAPGSGTWTFDFPDELYVLNGDGSVSIAVLEPGDIVQIVLAQESVIGGVTVIAENPLAELTTHDAILPAASSIVVTATDLDVTKTPRPGLDPLKPRSFDAPGADIKYDVVVKNTGLQALDTVKVEENIGISLDGLTPPEIALLPHPYGAFAAGSIDPVEFSSSLGASSTAVITRDTTSPDTIVWIDNLAPDEEITLLFEYTTVITDAGTVIRNQITVSEDVFGNYNSYIDSVGLTIGSTVAEKKYTGPAALEVGDIATWDITIENVSDAALPNVVVQELLAGAGYTAAFSDFPNPGSALSPSRDFAISTSPSGFANDTLTLTSLLAGEKVTLTISAPVTAADLAAGSLINEALVNGLSVKAKTGPVISPFDTKKVYTGVEGADPSKIAQPLKVGDVVTWDVVIKNNGAAASNVTVRELLTDAYFGAVSSDVGAHNTLLAAGSGYTISSSAGGFANDTLTLATFAAGETITIKVSYVVKAADVATGVHNSVEVNGAISTTDPTIPEPPVSGLTVHKVYTGNPVLERDQIATWTVTVKNDGSTPALLVTVQENLADAVMSFTDDGYDAATASLLVVPSIAPGETVTIYVYYKVTAADVAAGKIENSVDVNGVTTPTDPVPGDPGISKLKTTKYYTGNPSLALNDIATWTVVIQNIGTATETNITVHENLVGAKMNLGSDVGYAAATLGQDATIPSLTVGSSVTFYVYYKVTPADVAAGKVVNSVDVNGATVPTDPVPGDPSLSSLTVHKVYTGNPVLERDQIATWIVTIYNGGSAPALLVQVHENLVGARMSLTDGGYDLASIGDVIVPAIEVGDTATVYVYYKVTDADVTAGAVHNSVDVNGVTTPTDPVDDPIISKVKTTKIYTGSPLLELDNIATWTITIVNVSAADATNVVVHENLVGAKLSLGTPVTYETATTGQDLTVPSIPAGESVTIYVYYKVTAADVAAGKIVNSVVVDGATVPTDPGSPDPGTGTREKTAAPVINQPYEYNATSQANFPLAPPNISGTVSGTGVAGATVTVTFPGASPIIAATVVDAGGIWSFDLSAQGVQLSAGDSITASQQRTDYGVSDNTAIIVRRLAPDSPNINPVHGATTVVNPDNSTSYLDEGDRTVSGTGEAGATVTVVLPGASGPLPVVTAVDAGGNWTVAVPTSVILLNGETVSATQKQYIDPLDSLSASTTVIDARTYKLAPPTINPVYNGDTTISGTGQSGALVTVTLPNGQTVDATVNASGTWSISVPSGVFVKVNQPVRATQIAPIPPGGSYDRAVASDAHVVFADIRQSAVPSINAVAAGAGTISGGGIAGSTIAVYFPDFPGRVASTTVASNGTWSVSVPSGVTLRAGNVVGATQTQLNYAPSAAAGVSVPAAAVTQPPTQPTQPGQTIVVNNPAQPTPEVRVNTPQVTAAPTVTTTPKPEPVVTKTLDDTVDPLAGLEPVWAPLNLVLALIGVLGALAYGIAQSLKRRKKDSDGYEGKTYESVAEKKRRNTAQAFRMVGFILAALGIVVFSLTVDFGADLVIADNWTAFFAMILISEAMALVASHYLAKPDQDLQGDVSVAATV
jgi:hypothetical protein